MKAVLGTNALVAAFIADGVCRRLLLRARDRDFTLVVSPVIRAELAATLTRKVGATRAEVAEAPAEADHLFSPIRTIPSVSSSQYSRGTLGPRAGSCGFATYAGAKAARPGRKPKTGG